MNHLIVGIGGTGGKTIRSLRKLIFAECRDKASNISNVEYLYIDSSKEMMGQTDPSWKVLGSSVQLASASQLQITGEDLAGLLSNVNNYPGIKGWIGSERIWREILGTIVGEALGGQKRRLGRFLFARRIKEFNAKVQTLVQNLQQNGNAKVTFHVIAGLAGGTGSGCILDVIAQLRKTFADPLKYRIMAYLLLPDQHPLPNWDSGNYHSNGFAALTELNALSTGAYKPIDVETGNVLSIKDPFNGAYLISNENENGYIANIDSEIPRILAEFLFQKIYVAGAVGLTSIDRMENAENGDGTPETSATAKTGQRSKRFLSFGIKRITIPEEEIKEYLTLSFAQQGIQQLRYNNWQQALGYINEPQNFDANALVRSVDVQTNWRLNDDFLILAQSILGSDDQKRTWKSIHTEWESVVPAFKQLAQEQGPKNWITALTSYFQKRFDESFRNLGVKEFYRTKGLSKIDMAKEIRSIIEQDLLEQWKNGTRSLQEIGKIIDALSLLLQEKADQADLKVVKTDNQLDEVRSQIATNLTAWSSIGIIGKTLGKRDNLFERQAILLQDLFTNLTRLEALAFAKSLLLEINSEVRDLKNVVDSLGATVQQATTQISTGLEERLRDNEQSDAKGHLIRFYDPNSVRTSVKELTTSEPIQAAHTSKIRASILSKLGEDLSFAKLYERVSVTDLVDSVTSSSEESALAAHANMISESNRRILGVSILSKLEERYGANQSGLRLKIHELVTQAGTFLTINRAERDKVAPGIPAGSQSLISKTVVILPRAPSQDGFVKELKEAFRASMSGDLEFIEADGQQSEITILTIKNLFPVRMVGILPYLQDKYQQRVASNPERMAMELHTAGMLEQYPSLFAQSGTDLKREAGIKILIGLALGLVVNSTKRRQLVFNSKDQDGFDNPPIELGVSVIEAMSKVSFDMLDSISLGVETAMKGGVNLTQSEATIKQCVEQAKSDVGDDIADPAYQLLIDCAKTSLTIIREAIE